MKVLQLSSLLLFIFYKAGDVRCAFDSKIIGGRKARFREFKYAAVFVTLDRKPTCMGTIITPNTLLTAAHCFHLMHKKSIIHINITEILVVGGSRYTTYKEEGYEERMIKYVKEYPNYSIKENDLSLNDLAFVILISPFTLSTSIKPVRIYSKNKKIYKRKWENYLQNRATCYTIGFGATIYRKDNYSHMPLYEKTSEYLKVHKVRLMTYKDCHYYFPFNLAYVKENDFVCVASDKMNDGLCEGDSGSPLICDKYIFGIFTSSEDCGEHGVPQIFINVVKVIGEFPSAKKYHGLSGLNRRCVYSFKTVILASMTVFCLNFTNSF